MHQRTGDYENLIKDIIENGVKSDDRTGVGTTKVFSRNLVFDLKQGFPIITTRKVSLRIAFEELKWMMSGSTDANVLKDKNIFIWNGNTTTEFQQSVGLGYLKEGSIGKGYGWQIRNYGADYTSNDEHTDGVDQLSEVVKSLTENPNGRRHIMCYWNPSQLSEAVLPPCHLYCQFVVTGNTLNLQWVQRSVDVPYGLPYNIMFYSLLLTFIASITGYEVGEVAFNGVDVHIYDNQMNMCKDQIKRIPYDPPVLHVKKQVKSIEDMLSLEYTDLELIGYQTHPDYKDKPSMAV